MTKRLIVVALAVLGFGLTGCPDYSHLRDKEPDWTKQGESSVEGESEQENTP